MPSAVITVNTSFSALRDDDMTSIRFCVKEEKRKSKRKSKSKSKDFFFFSSRIAGRLLPLVLLRQQKGLRSSRVQSISRMHETRVRNWTRQRERERGELLKETLLRGIPSQTGKDILIGQKDHWVQIVPKVSWNKRYSCCLVTTVTRNSVTTSTATQGLSCRQ